MTMRIVGLIPLVTLTGCLPELPPLEYRGERVVVGSDVVDQVCGGTLARLDREVVQIEKQLDLGPKATPLNVYIVSAETVAAYCDGHNCTEYPKRGAAFVLLNYDWLGRAPAHELIHARLAAQRTAPLLAEGVAEAVAPPLCPRAMPQDLNAENFLTAEHSSDLLDVPSGYYVAGELAAWLLDEFGADAFLSLYADVDKRASASAIKSAYRDHFKREIEDDLFAHARTREELDALPPEHFGCLAPPAPSTDGVISLKASLDCGSELVHNTPGRDGQGYVEWTLTLDRNQRFELRGAVPECTSLTLTDCACLPRRGLGARPFDEEEIIERGTHRLRWYGALDEGLALDVALVPAH